MNCNCDKAATENKVAGARCSCRARPAGACNCDRANVENKVEGSTCACGKRPSNACTCENAPGGGLLPGEIDFTTKSSGA
ncbi:MAG: hypothetical protein MMC33_001977 [Icmadophila ericetorum]|nr:hypothetical protein [Icmadophila ericetorum]